MELSGSRIYRSVSRSALTLALIIAVLTAVAGCGGHAPVEAQELTASPTTAVVEAAPATSTPVPPTATSEPQSTEVVPAEPEPTATVSDPFVPNVPDPEPEEEAGSEDIEVTNIDVEDLQTRVEELIGEVDGELEIVVALDDGTVLYERDSFEPMESASLYKLAIMVELFRQRDAGELSFDESIVLLPDYFLEEDGVYDWDWIGSAADLDSLLTNMITLSSNVAAAALLARLGNDAINETMANLGLVDTIIRWTPGIWVPASSASPDGSDDEVAPRALAAVGDETIAPDSPDASVRAEEALNVTTAADVAALFQLLLDGEVVSPEASAEMLDLLSQQQIQDRIPLYLPEGTVIAHKTGNWDGLVHDAGVIWSPAGPVIVVVLSDIYDEGRAVELIANIALEAYLFER